MDRRSFLTTAGVGLAASTVAAPAIAQTQPEIKWRMASSFPKSIDAIFGISEMLAKRVADLTDNKFQIRVFASGEIVPGLQVLDAVQNGTVECGHTANYYYVGKDPAFCFDTCMPFGMNARQQNAWMYEGGGLELMREFLKGYNVIQFPAGNTGAQMGGWFRKEIKGLADMSGLKMRVSGLAGQIQAKMGVVPQQIAAGDIYPALEKGTIDAAEWVGPYDDEKLGFAKVAKYYYYPGWWEGGPMLSVVVNLQQWEQLPKTYKAALEVACAEANGLMLARYDANNTAAVKRLVAQGAVLKRFPTEVMSAAYKIAFEIYEDIASKNAAFKKIYEPWLAFREDQYTWTSICENSFDNFVLQAARQKSKKG